MTPDTAASPPPRTFDLTGLPDAVVQEVVRIVEAARAGNPVTTADPRPRPTFIRRSTLTPEEFGKALDAMAAMGTGTVLQGNLSRAEIYDDHD